MGNHIATFRIDIWRQPKTEWLCILVLIIGNLFGMHSNGCDVYASYCWVDCTNRHKFDGTRPAKTNEVVRFFQQQVKYTPTNKLQHYPSSSQSSRPPSKSQNWNIDRRTSSTFDQSIDQNARAVSALQRSSPLHTIMSAQVSPDRYTRKKEVSQW